MMLMETLLLGLPQLLRLFLSSMSEAGTRFPSRFLREGNGNVWNKSAPEILTLKMS